MRAALIHDRLFRHRRSHWSVLDMSAKTAHLKKPLPLSTGLRRPAPPSFSIVSSPEDWWS
jgi:hypothetical protein